MRSITVAIAAAALLVAPRADELRTSYSEGLEVTCASERWLRIELDTASGTVNGEELPPEAVDEMGGSFPAERTEERMEWTTRYEEVEDGRPTVARRRFETLERHLVEGEEETEESGPLEGRAIVLRAGEDGEVEVQLAEDEERGDVEPAHLEDHRLELLVEDCLPAGEVEVGDSWELDEKAARRLAELEGAPTLFDLEEDDERFEELLRERASVAGEVRYAKEEERDGVRCALLEVELTMTLEADDLDPSMFGDEADEDLEGWDASFSIDMTLEFSGSLWFAVEAGRPLEQETRLEGTMTMGMTMSQGGMELVLEFVADMEGVQETSWSYAE